MKHTKESVSETIGDAMLRYNRLHTDPDIAFHLGGLDVIDCFLWEPEPPSAAEIHRYGEMVKALVAELELLAERAAA